MNTDGHGWGKELDAKFASSPSVFIRVHPWLNCSGVRRGQPGSLHPAHSHARQGDRRCTDGAIRRQKI